MCSVGRCVGRRDTNGIADFGKGRGSCVLSRLVGVGRKEEYEWDAGIHSIVSEGLGGVVKKSY